MSNHETFDYDQFKDKLNELKAEIKVPEPTNWDSVHAQIQKHAKRKKRFRSIKQICSIAAAALLISIFINGNNSTISAKFTSLFKVVKDEVTYIFLSGGETTKRGSAATNSPSDMYNILTEKYGNNDLQAQLKRLSFIPPLPTYLPSEFYFSGSNIFDENVEYPHDLLTYYKIKFINSEGKKINIDYKDMSNIESLAIEANYNSTILEIIDINNNKAVLLEEQGGFKTIEWITEQNVKITILSDISKEELVKIAQSLK